MNQKQRLLDKEAYQKKLKKQRQKQAIERQQALIKQKMAALQQPVNIEPEQTEKVKTKSKFKYYFYLLLLLILVVFPYPKVIVYEKLGVVAQSIYIPSRFGSPDIFLDTHYQVNLDEAHRWLYLCDRQALNNCNRYDIVEIKGFISAVKLYFTGSL